MASGKILVAQGGGPTATIDRPLFGVVLEATRCRGTTRLRAAAVPGQHRT